MIRVIIGLVLVVLISVSAFGQEFPPKEQLILDKVLAYHKNNLECDGHGSDMESSEFIRFVSNSEYRPDTIVVMVTCSFHAYQVSWVAYSVYDDGDPDISILSFPTTIDGKQWTADKFLMSPDWDRKTKTLSTAYKGRGIADCGAFKSYRWNGYSFYLDTANYQVCCWNEEDFEKRPECAKIKDIYPIPSDEWPLVYQYTSQ